MSKDVFVIRREDGVEIAMATYDEVVAKARAIDIWTYERYVPADPDSHERPSRT